jgi:hypothetical protein
MPDEVVRCDEVRGKRMKKKRYSDLIKWAVAKKIVSGMSGTEVERQFGIPDSTAREWSGKRLRGEELWPIGLTSKGDC